jgi:sugar phosphate permease
MLPFSALASDSATWAIVIAHFAHDWCWYVAVSWLPTYFVETHRLPVQTAALYSAFPFLTQLVTTLLAGSTADWLAQSGKPSRVLAVRRAATTAGFLGSASFLVLSQWQPAEQPVTVMLCFCAAFGFDGMHVGGYLINAADIAPDHAGSVKGLGDTAGCLAGFLANIAVGTMSAHHIGNGSFYSTFLMLGIVQILGAAAYFMLADGKPRFGSKAEAEAEALQQRQWHRSREVGVGVGRDSFVGAVDWGAGMSLGVDESGTDVLVR